MRVIYESALHPPMEEIAQARGQQMELFRHFTHLLLHHFYDPFPEVEHDE